MPYRITVENAIHVNSEQCHSGNFHSELLWKRPYRYTVEMPYKITLENAIQNNIGNYHTEIPQKMPYIITMEMSYIITVKHHTQYSISRTPYVIIYIST